MAFRTRCPECRSKLEFDEAPDAEEAVECTRCGHVFDGAEAKPIKKKMKVTVGGGDDDEKPRKTKKNLSLAERKKTAPKKRKIMKKKANLLFLWIMLAAVAVLGPFLGWFAWKLWFSPGKMGALMAYVPAECNLMRGVDCERLGMYVGYAEQLKSAMDGPFAMCRDEFAAAAGAEPEKFMDYCLSGKIKDGTKSGTVLVFQTIAPYDASHFEKKLNGKKESIDGQEVYRLPTRPEPVAEPGGAKPRQSPLSGALVFCPAPKHIVVVPPDGDPARMMKLVIAAKNTPTDGSMYPKLGPVGTKTCRSNIWTLMRCTGDFKTRLKVEMGEPIKSSYGSISTRLNAAKMMGTWMYFGKYIKFGVAIDCDSADTADEFAKDMKEGEFGKGDDAELARDFRLLFYLANTAEFKQEFMANLKFKTVDECAYAESKMMLAKAMMGVLGFFNRPEMWEGEAGDGGAGRRGGR